MTSRTAALGGRLRTAALVACLAAGLLVGVGTPPAAAAPIDDPMTGLLPACPAQMHETVSQDVWVEADGTDPFDAAHEGGLLNNCAWQNMQDRNNSSLWPRAGEFKAEPNTVSINDVPTTIRFSAVGGAAPGPFNATLPDCMPLSTRAGGCGDNTEDPTPYVAYRLANGAGFFQGRWTLVVEPGDNPYFDLTRDQNGCADNYPNWSPNYRSPGLPCDYELRFATAPGGAPVLTSAMQVVVGIRWLYGTKTVNSLTGYEYGYTAMVPMLFTPGTSSSLALDALPSRVAWDSPLTLRATAVGPPAGSPVNFYRKGGNGVVTAVGQALTGADGVASLATRATGNAEYWARLAVGGTETAQSPTRAVSVGRTVALAAKQPKKKGGKVEFAATLSPGSPGQVVLQRKAGTTWVTAATGNAAPTLTWKLKVPPGKQTYRVLVASSTDFVESVSNEVKAKGKKKKPKKKKK